MTDEEWGSSRDGVELCKSLWSRCRRKMRLIKIAFTRRIVSVANDDRFELLLNLEVKCVEEGVISEEWKALKWTLEEFLQDRQDERFRRNKGRRQYAAQCAILSDDLPYTATNAAIAKSVDGRTPSTLENELQANLVRDILCNTLLLPSFDKRWRTSDTIGLARAIYGERAFDRLPILADALMDAGCEDEQIIAHCRSEGPHVRGCWVVDLVLGKT